jgi:hypothetical protein
MPTLETLWQKEASNAALHFKPLLGAGVRGAGKDPRLNRAIYLTGG